MENQSHAMHDALDVAYLTLTRLCRSNTGAVELPAVLHCFVDRNGKDERSVDDAAAVVFSLAQLDSTPNHRIVWHALLLLLKLTCAFKASVTVHTVRRMFAAVFVLSIKVLDDRAPPNSCLALAADLKLRDLNAAELGMLKALRFDVVISRERFVETHGPCPQMPVI